MEKKQSTPTVIQTQLQIIGKAFHMQRLELGKSIVEVSKGTGITEMTISQFEKGKLKNTSYQTIMKIADFLKLTLSVSVSPMTRNN